MVQNFITDIHSVLKICLTQQLGCSCRNCAEQRFIDAIAAIMLTNGCCAGNRPVDGFIFIAAAAAFNDDRFYLVTAVQKLAAVF